MVSPAQEVVWRPQPGPQKALIECTLPEVFFGGARGGGKTDGVLGKWAIKEQRYGEHFNAIMFRRTTVSSEDAIERSKEIYAPLGGRFVGSPIPRWKMPNGGRIAFAYLDRISDADEYQGRNVTDAWVEEAGQYPDSKPIDRLYGVLRSAHGVPVQLVLTANPGGAGQHWIRERYGLHPFPRDPKVLTRVLPNGQVHRIAVIPSRIADNRIIAAADPGYVGRLYMVGSSGLVRAWLEGDWSAVEGAFFDTWSEARHVVEPFTVPAHWTRFRSMDWGYAAPFSVGWWTVASDPHQAGSVTLPRGCMVRYREWYGASAPGTGLRLSAEEVARGIKQREQNDKVTMGVLDPSAFAESGGPSIGERMGREGVHFRAADNKRVAQRGALGGWDQMRARLKGDKDNNPMLVCFATCRDSIRTIPVLQHDPDRAEDLDTTAEDHAADDWRYGCMSRPWVRPEPVPPARSGRGYVSRDDADRDHSVALL